MNDGEKDEMSYPPDGSLDKILESNLPEKKIIIVGGGSLFKRSFVEEMFMNKPEKPAKVFYELKGDEEMLETTAVPKFEFPKMKYFAFGKEEQQLVNQMETEFAICSVLPDELFQEIKATRPRFEGSDPKPELQGFYEKVWAECEKEGLERPSFLFIHAYLDTISKGFSILDVAGTGHLVVDVESFQDNMKLVSSFMMTGGRQLGKCIRTSELMHDIFKIQMDHALEETPEPMEKPTNPKFNYLNLRHKGKHRGKRW